MFVAKITGQDIHQMVALLSMRVKENNWTYWEKLAIMIKCLNGTKKKMLTMSADDLKVIKWYMDANFAVIPDFNIHTRAIMTMGQGAMQSFSREQKLNTRSNTEAELVAVDDASV